MLSCVSNIAETYKLLVPYRDQFIDIADEFSQKGDEAYKNRDDVERCFDTPKKFCYVGFLIYLVKENACTADEVIGAFGKDFPKHAKPVDVNTADLDDKQKRVYEHLYNKVLAEELDDTTASEALMIEFDGEVVVSNDDGDGYKFSSESNLWEKKTKSQLARYIPDILGDYVRRIQNKFKQMALECEDEKLKLWLGKITKDLNSWLTRSIRAANGMKNIWTVLKSNLWNEDFEARLNINHDLFPTMDGNVVDLKTGQIRRRSKEDMFSFACPVKYIAQPNLSNVMRFVNSIFCDNQELIDYMRARMGMFLTGRNVREFDIWYGKGRNGKSSICRILGDIMKSGNFYNTLAEGIFISNPKLSQHRNRNTPRIWCP